MIFGNVAYLGSFNLRSALITAGVFIRIDSRPPSTSLQYLDYHKIIDNLLQ